MLCALLAHSLRPWCPCVPYPPLQILAEGSAHSVQALVACQGVPFIRDFIDESLQTPVQVRLAGCTRCSVGRAALEHSTPRPQTTCNTRASSHSR